MTNLLKVVLFLVTIGILFANCKSKENSKLQGKRNYTCNECLLKWKQASKYDSDMIIYNIVYCAKNGNNSDTTDIKACIENYDVIIKNACIDYDLHYEYLN